MKGINIWAIVAICVALAAALITIPKIMGAGSKNTLRESRASKRDAKVVKRECKQRCKFPFWQNKKNNECMTKCYAEAKIDNPKS